MVSWLQIATDYGIATVVGFVLNIVAKKLFPADIIKGDPRWVYYLSIFAQAFIFPPLAFLSWQENNYEFTTWFNEPWAKLPFVTFDRAYMAALWGYWAKDMFILSDPLIVVHHIFCMASLLISASIKELGGLGFIVCGTCALEAGTIWYNFSTLFDKSWLTRRLYWGIMTLTNVISPALAIQFYNAGDRYPLYARIWYIITVFGLAIGRQREIILDVVRSIEEDKERSKKIE